LFSLRILPCNCEVRVKEMPVIPVDKKRIIRKMEGQGGEPQGVADPPKWGAIN
jgi:hypothetical protein